jgi:hypothetical protein
MGVGSSGPQESLPQRLDVLFRILEVREQAVLVETLEVCFEVRPGGRIADERLDGGCESATSKPINSASSGGAPLPARTKIISSSYAE